MDNNVLVKIIKAYIKVVPISGTKMEKRMLISRIQHAIQVDDKIYVSNYTIEQVLDLSLLSILGNMGIIITDQH